MVTGSRHPLGHAEVDDLKDPAADTKQHVGWLQVKVDHAVSMHELEGHDQLAGDAIHQVVTHLTMLLQDTA